MREVNARPNRAKGSAQPLVRVCMVASVPIVGLRARGNNKCRLSLRERRLYREVICVPIPTRHSRKKQIGGQSPLLQQRGASARALVGAGSVRRSQVAHRAEKVSGKNLRRGANISVAFRGAKNDFTGKFVAPDLSAILFLPVVSRSKEDGRQEPHSKNRPTLTRKSPSRSGMESSSSASSKRVVPSAR